jgi:hypothetical protein
MSTLDILGGLAVVSLRGEGKCWYVEHAGSGLDVHGGSGLRQKRFAVEARADLLATGVDWTLSVADLRGQLGAVWPVVTLWRKRAGQVGVDLVTGEYYPAFTPYGPKIPSKANAERIAVALACYAWS